MATKRYRLSFADSTAHVPDHPERTAIRSIGDDVEYQVWPSAGAMQTSVSMQGSRASSRYDWRPWLTTNTAKRLLGAKPPSGDPGSRRSRTVPATRRTRRGRGRDPISKKTAFPQRELVAVTLKEAVDKLSSELGEAPPEGPAGRFGFASEALDVLRDWENSVQDQLGRKIRFRHWKEYTPRGFWRYFSVHQPSGRFAIVEEEAYGATSVTNSSSYIFRSRATQR